MPSKLLLMKVLKVELLKISILLITLNFWNLKKEILLQKFHYNETFFIFSPLIKEVMDKFFEILFLDETFEFLKNLDRKHYQKILYNIR